MTITEANEKRDRQIRRIVFDLKSTIAKLNTLLSNHDRVTIKEWANMHEDIISVRLYNVLNRIDDVYIEDITRDQFRLYKGVGEGSVKEFFKLRKQILGI